MSTSLIRKRRPSPSNQKGRPAASMAQPTLYSASHPCETTSWTGCLPVRAVPFSIETSSEQHHGSDGRGLCPAPHPSPSWSLGTGPPSPGRALSGAGILARLRMRCAARTGRTMSFDTRLGDYMGFQPFWQSAWLTAAVGRSWAGGTVERRQQLQRSHVDFQDVIPTRSPDEETSWKL